MKYKYNNYEIDSDCITKDDMPNELFKEMCDLCSIEAALSILVNYRGSTIQVPVNGLRKIEEKIILQDYHGTTKDIRDISRKLIVSETYIRDVLNRAKIATPLENQLGIGLKIEENEV